MPRNFVENKEQFVGVITLFPVRLLHASAHEHVCACVWRPRVKLGWVFMFRGQ